MNNTINNLNRRYATKQFDPTKKINQTDLDVLIESLRLSPSSFGLQPWKFLHITNPQIRQQLQDNSRGQTQITQASDLIVIATKTNLTENDVDAYMENIIATRKTWDMNALLGFKNMILQTISSRSAEELRIWNQKQAYIAMGVLLTTCAELHIDSCPMEGFDPIKYNEILWLDKQGLTTTVVIPVGYRSSEDKYAELAKVRFPKEKIYEKIA